MKQQLLNVLGIGPKQSNPEEMSFPVIRVLIFFSVALGVILLASNLAALKVWNLFGIPVDAGIWLFPVVYIIGDLLVEIYGQKVANLVSFYCALFAVIVAAVLAFAKVALMDFPGVDNSAFEIIQSATGRIFLASVAGFLAGQFINNGIFAYLRAKERNQNAGFLKRALLSSAVAHFFDSLIFETLAFVGRVSLGDFIAQAAFAYVAGIILEFVLSPLTNFLAKKSHQQLKYSNGKKLK